jgi:hypothetical protein
MRSIEKDMTKVTKEALLIPFELNSNHTMMIMMMMMMMMMMMLILLF